MAHSFVIAKLLPNKSSNWTSYYGCQKAPDIPTAPFLVLRLHATDVHLGDPSQPTLHSILFIVSSKKPTGATKDCYFALNPIGADEHRALVVDPPLPTPDDCPLYVYTFPKLHARYTSEINVAGDQYSGPYKLDEPSFRAFSEAVMEDHRRRAELLESRSSGGDDVVEDHWETWSAMTFVGTEHLSQPMSCVYELTDWANTTALPFHSSIYDELLVYKQFASDYSWNGVTRSISWLKGLRSTKQTTQISLLIEDTPIDARGKEALKLHHMPIPYDDRPLINDNSDHSDHSDSSECSDTEWDDDDELQPDFHVLYERQFVVPATDVKVIAFELLGTIFDREDAIRNAVTALAPADWEARTSRRLLDIYIECETHRLKDASNNTSYADVARSSLFDVCKHLGTSPEEASLSAALDILLHPKICADAAQAVHSLHRRGYTLLGIPSLDPSTFAQHIQPFVPPELSTDIPPSAWQSPHKQNSNLFPALLERAQSIHSGIQPSQILVVTTAPYRIVEPACTAKFPTVLVQRAGSVESKVVLDTATPTVTIKSLSELEDQLDGVELKQPSAVPPERPIGTFYPYRVSDHYQVTALLGVGSFGNVVSAMHVLTGEGVAIKREMHSRYQPDQEVALPDGERFIFKPRASRAQDICVLPYEAQVYRQLRGYQGIPSVRWFGMYGGGYFLILDRTGVTLEQLRRLCRGQLSMKTVTLVAIEMLNRLEFLHSRGIIWRDVKPNNISTGRGAHSSFLYMFDFGLAKQFIDPVTGEHMPYRDGLVGLGTARFASHNVHFGREPARRDDMEALGNSLLYLLHGRLPWQGIYGPTVAAKSLRIGEMKAGKPFRDLLAQSPPEFTAFFDHCRSLAFEEEPDYALLRRIFEEKMKAEGWDANPKYDWEDPESLEKGTLLPAEYKLNPRFAKNDLGW